MSGKGFVNSLEGLIKNTNYSAKKTTVYKTAGMINEISSVLSFKTSLPLIKEGINFSKIFTPNLMLRYAPGHMRSLRDKNVNLNIVSIQAFKTKSIHKVFKVKK